MSQADALYAEARARLAVHPEFAAIPPAEQTRMVRRDARELALFRSPIGRTAAAIAEALGDLEAAVRSFLADWPDRAAAEAAGDKALAAAGVSPDPDTAAQVSIRGYSMFGDHFAHLPEELARWLPMLELFAERVEECDDPDDLDLGTPGPWAAERGAA